MLMNYCGERQELLALLYTFEARARGGYVLTHITDTGPLAHTLVLV